MYKHVCTYLCLGYFVNSFSHDFYSEWPTQQIPATKMRKISISKAAKSKLYDIPDRRVHVKKPVKKPVVLTGGLEK